MVGVQAPEILPASYPDLLREAAYGATVYVHPQDVAGDSPRDAESGDESAAWIVLDSGGSVPQWARLVARLRDGTTRILAVSSRVRVVALEAITDRENW